MDGTDPLFALAGKTALVTGGTSGIGAMIARAFVSRGATTYVTGRDAERAQAAATAIAEECGGTCTGLAANFAQPDAPALLAADLARREDALHILVNNAGTNAPGALASLEIDAWDEVMAVNLRAPVFLVKELLSLLQAGASETDPARVINVGSIGGLHVPGWEAHPYGASKAALHHVTRSLAKSLGGDQITVNAIAPGPFPSNMHDTDSAATQRSIETYIPLRRAGAADDAAGAAVFLTSRAGAYVNGHVIPLDGGYIAAL